VGKRDSFIAQKSRQSGLTLLELLVAMTLTAVLLLGLVQLVTASGAAALLQENQAILQDRERFATRLLGNAIASAGFSPRPWDGSPDRPAVAPGTADRYTTHGDRLVLSSWSDRNCFDNLNPVRDAQGRPRFFLRETAFDLNGSRHLARSCRYGPGPADLVVQVRHEGLVPGVESFQLLFGLDADDDGNVERWVRAGGWAEEQHLIAIRAGLLLAGPDRVTSEATRSYRVLDSARNVPDDGRLRHHAELTFAIRGRRR
jgi:type IV pilus assembly protein PilW